MLPRRLRCKELTQEMKVKRTRMTSSCQRELNRRKMKEVQWLMHKKRGNLVAGQLFLTKEERNRKV